MKPLKYWQAVNRALDEELARDERVIVFGEDVGRPGGPFGATRGLQEKYGARRVRDTPICEPSLMGAAVGAAMAGSRPVVEIMFFDFITLAMDQLVNQAAKMTYMSGGGFKVPLTVRVLCGQGRGSGPQHSQSLEGWLAHVPGLKVVWPSNPRDARGLLKSAIRDDSPVVVIDSLTQWGERAEVPEGEEGIVPLGKAKVARPGTDVTIVSWGSVTPKALAAAEQLAAEGVEAEVVDLRSLSPLDEEAIVASVRKTRRLLVVHNAVERFGPGAEIVSLATQHAFSVLKAPPARLGGPFAPIPFTQNLEAAYFPSPDSIAARALKLVRAES